MEILGHTPIAESIQGLAAASLQSIQAVGDSALDLSNSLTTTAPEAANFQLPPLNIELPQVDLAELTDEIADKVTDTATAALPAIGRAGARLGSEFGEAGKTLGSNFGIGAKLAGKAVVTLATNAVNSPLAVTDAVVKLAPSVVDEATKFVTSTASTFSSTIDVTQKQLTVVSEGVSNLAVLQESFWEEQVCTSIVSAFYKF